MNLLQTFSQELETLVARTAPAVVGVEHHRGHGTGFILSGDGYVLTNAHVVEGARRVEIRVSRGDTVRGELVGADPRSDLAVLRADTQALGSLALADSKKLKVGQLVVAIGNPLRFERSVSLGVVSAIDRSLPTRGPGAQLEGLVQTDAAINPGNSGGPLLDASGEVVGINTAIIPFAQGIGFAIPSHTASWVTAVLISKGEVVRPMIGIAARSEELSAAAGLLAGQMRAVRILGVGVESPAAAAGLLTGDLLVGVNDSPVASVDDLQRVLVLGGGPAFELSVVRGREHRKFSVRPVVQSRAA